MDDQLLKYRFLNEFDAAMNNLEEKYGWLHHDPVNPVLNPLFELDFLVFSITQGYVSTKHQGDKVVSFDRAGLVFVFNFNSSKSFTDYRIGAPVAGKYRIVLDSDDKQFGGHHRLDHNTDYFSLEEPFAGRQHSLMVFYK